MIFFTSDLHFGHRNIIKYCNRPYQTIEEMDEDLIRRWNEQVGMGDTVYCLGDFSLSKGAVRDYTSRLNGRKTLCSGNHDWTHPVHKKHHKMAEKYLEWGWSEVIPQELVTSFEGLREVRLCHIPYTNEDGRYPDFRPKDDGKLLLHGHVHCAWLKRGNQINVGVDRHDMTPVSLERIIELSKVEGDL